MPDLACAVELVRIPGKGRGLRATRDLARWSLVVLDGPLVHTKIDSRDAASLTMAFDGVSHTMSDASSVRLRAQAVDAAAREPLVAGVLLSLDDTLARQVGSDSPANPADASGGGVAASQATSGPSPTKRELPLKPLPELQHHLSVRVLPLLPSWAEYFPLSERRAPSAAFVHRVCGVHSSSSVASDRVVLHACVWNGTHQACSLCLHVQAAWTAMACFGQYIPDQSRCDQASAPGCARVADTSHHNHHILQCTVIAKV